MDRLIKYEKHLKTAYIAKYVRNLRKAEIDELAIIYSDLLGLKIGNKNCNSCVYNMVYKLAQYYYGNTESKCEKEQERKQTKCKGKRTSTSK